MGRLRFVILTLWLALWPYLVTAQVAMEVQLGLQGTVRLEKWNLVTVHLHNTGPPLVGTLGVRVWRGSDFRKDRHVTTYTQLAELPYRSRKRFTFAVPITSTTHPVEVFLHQGEQRLAHQQLNLREALNAEHLILGLTRDLGLDFLATSFQRHTRVVYLSPRDLPQRWSGYDSISAVVVKGISLQALTRRQSTALRQWVARGGVLVVAGDSQYALLQQPLLRELLPVAALGIQQLEGLPAFAEHYDMPMPATPLLAVRSNLLRGRVLVGTDALPLLAERNFGKGRVVFLAVDYAAQPLASWKGNKALWKDILQPTERIDFGRVFAALGLLDDAHPIIKLLRRPILAYPTHPTLSFFLLAYGGILALLFWRMGKRRIGHGRYWLYVGLIILATTGSAYALLPEHGLRRPALVADLTTMEVLADTGYSHMRGYIGLFSPRGGHYTLDFQHPETILRHTFHRGNGQAGDNIEITTRGEFAIHGITLDPWMLRVFSLESIVSSPVHVKSKRYTTGMTVQVKNQGSLSLRDIVVLYRGELFPLGSIAPGEEMFKDLYTPLQPLETKHETIWQALFKQRPTVDDPQLSFLQEAILQHYFGDQFLTETRQTPFLVGWLIAPSTLRQAAGLSLRGVTLVISHLKG